MLHDCDPGLGPGAPRLTRLPGCWTGSGLSRSWLKSEKMAAFAPMPSASEATATLVTKGVLKRLRSATFRLSMICPHRKRAREARDPSPVPVLDPDGCDQTTR